MVTEQLLKIALKEEAKAITIPAQALWIRLHWSLGPMDHPVPQRSAPGRRHRARSSSDRRNGPHHS